MIHFYFMFYVLFLKYPTLQPKRRRENYPEQFTNINKNTIIRPKCLDRIFNNTAGKEKQITILFTLEFIISFQVTGPQPH